MNTSNISDRTRSTAGRTWLVLAGAIVCAVLAAQPVWAQQYIEPTSPSGGSTAWPLNSSSNAQLKRGTLIIGQAGGNAKLCLNTNDPNDPFNCISSWSNAGSFVKLKNLVPGNGYQPTDLRAYESADSGYARIQATGSNLYTLILEANSSPASGASATALVATDGGNAANYAANFQGKVFVGFPTSLADAKLCLNGEATIDTTPGDTTFGKGCITAWSQIAAIAAAGNYVLLQPTTAIPNPQSGQVAISGGAAFASDTSTTLVIGAPAAGTPTSVTCGDGICNASECALNTTPACSVGNANYCPSDCDRTPPANVVMNPSYAINRFVGYYTITGLNWTNPSDGDFAGTRILRTIVSPPTGPTGSANETVNILSPTHAWNDPVALSYNNTYYYMFYSYDAAGNFASGVQLQVYVSSSSNPPPEGPPGGGGPGGSGGFGGGQG